MLILLNFFKAYNYQINDDSVDNVDDSDDDC